MPSLLPSLSVLDGGFTSQLEKNGKAKDKKSLLWGAEANIKDENAVQAVHTEYLEQGVDILTTNTYQAGTDLIRRLLPECNADPNRLYTAAVRLAREAISQAGRVALVALVAGAVGPYGACLGDGSEYTGEYIATVPESELEQWHMDRIRGLCQAGVDMIAVETMPSKVEVRCVLNVLHKLRSEFQTPFWVSYQCRGKGAKTALGEPFSEAVSEVLQHPASKEGRLLAVGVNCSEPGVVSDLLKAANTVNADKIPYIVYPNFGGEWDAKNKVWSVNEDDKLILSRVPEWLGLGARVFGGCCRVGPETIGKIRETLLASVVESGSLIHSEAASFAPWQEVEALLRKKENKNSRKRHLEEIRGLEDIVDGMKMAPGLTTAHQIEEVMAAVMEKFTKKK